MQFLGFFDKIDENIQSAVIDVLRTVFYFFDSIIYGLISFLYKTYDIICHVQIIDIGVVRTISQRVGLLLGVIMLFYVTVSFIQMILNPDSATDNKKGATALVKRAIIVLALLGSSTYTFATLSNVQEWILDSRIIEHIIIPGEVDTTNFGGVFAAKLLNAFYYFDTSIPIETEETTNEESDTHTETTISNGYGSWTISSEDKTLPEECKKYEEINIYQIANSNDFAYGKRCLRAAITTEDDLTKKEEETYIMQYHFGISTAVGVVVAWMLLIYTINVGTRAIFLAVLQIIAPVAIISYLSPKDDSLFTKWRKKYITIYADLFIRIAIFNLIIYLIAIIVDGMGLGNGNVMFESMTSYYNNTYNASGMPVLLKTYISVMIIIALLNFAKKAPELLKELMPAVSGGLGFGIKPQDTPGLGMAKNGFVKGTKAIGKFAGMRAAGKIGGIASARSRYLANKNRGVGTKKALASAAMGYITGSARSSYAALKEKSSNPFSQIRAGYNAQRQADDRYIDLINQGGSVMGSYRSRVQDFFGGETRAQRDERILNNVRELAKYRDNAYAAAEKIQSVASAKEAFDNTHQLTGESDVHFENRLRRLKSNYDNRADAAFEAAAIGLNGYKWQSSENFEMSAFSESKNPIQAYSAFERHLQEIIKDNCAKAASIYAGDPTKRDNFIKEQEEQKQIILEQFRKQCTSTVEVDDGSGNISRKVVLNDNIDDFNFELTKIEAFDPNDDRRISQVQSNYAQAESLANATNAEYYDPYLENEDGTRGGFVSYKDTFVRKEGETIEQAEAAGRGKAFRSLTKNRDNTESYVTSQEGYREAIANDKAANIGGNNNK